MVVSKMHSGRILLFIYLILVSACKGYESENNQDQYLGYMVDTVDLPLDSVSNFEFYWTQYLEEDGAGALAVLNKVSNSLDFYDLEKKTMSKRIPLSTDDKFGAFQANGFYYYSPDTIFIYPSYTLNGTLIINSRGEVLHRVVAPIPNESEHSYALNHVSSPSSPSVYLDGKVHASIASMRSSSAPSGLSESYKSNITLDPMTGDIRFIPHIGYPDAYVGKSVTDHHSVLCRALVNEEYWVHSYPLLDSVMLYDRKYHYLGKRFAGSDHFDGFVAIKNGGRLADQAKYVIENSSYARIFYDKYRKLFYRVVLIGRKFNPTTDQDSRDNSRNRFSIFVLDEEFNLLKEVEFPSKKYYHYSAFVGKNGLYLPKINKDYEELSEDMVSYDVFDLSQE